MSPLLLLRVPEERCGSNNPKRAEPSGGLACGGSGQKLKRRASAESFGGFGGRGLKCPTLIYSLGSR
eukprot:15456422-Alexandrium_andersonii.AAC.1